MIKPFKPRSFIDTLRIYVRGGTGGKGLQRYGGLGGRGGSVYVYGNKNTQLKHLRDVTPNLRFMAEVGQDSSRRTLVGEAGKDVEIPVPLGVIVRTDSGRVIGEVNEDGDRVLVAAGAAGGSPENGFQQGKCQGINLTMDLKLIADIGLVGFPNAGKSTLLRAVSRAMPKVAAYPFTTIRPNIGTIIYEDSRQIKMADLPGLIEGAHINIGMGHKFLKHVERTSLLLFMVDLTGFRLKVDSPMRSPFETMVLLWKEMELYNKEMCKKPAALVLNKIDLPLAREMSEEMMEKVQNIQDHLYNIPEPLHPEEPINFQEIFCISAAKGDGVEELKVRLREILDEQEELRIKTETTNIEKFERKLARSLTESHSLKGSRMV